MVMDYEQFKQYVKDHIKEFLPQEFKSYEVALESQIKNNNCTQSTISIKTSGNVKPVIYLAPAYESYCHGELMETVIEKMARAFEDSYSNADMISLLNFNYEDIKDNIYVAVRNADWNQNILANIPHEIREDLVLNYRVKVQSGEITGSFQVQNTHLKMWGIDEQMLKEIAWNNMHSTFQPHIMSLAPWAPSDDMLVLTRHDYQDGAAYMFDEECVAKIAKKYDTDVIIIPSSIHETILVKSDGKMDIEKIQEMVEEVNATCVKEEEVLSNSVYLFEKDTLSLSRFDPGEQAQGMNMTM